MRLFIAIDIGERVRESLTRAIQDLSTCAPEAKWVKPENAHVTLVFLGEVDEARVPPLVKALDQTASKHPAVTVAVEGGGYFGKPSRPRVLWAGLTGDVEALSSLQRDIEDAMDVLGHPVQEREFHPHLTVARARDFRGDSPLARCVEQLKQMKLGSAQVSEVLLIKSVTSPAGAKYEVLHRSKLTQPGIPALDFAGSGLARHHAGDRAR